MKDSELSLRNDRQHLRVPVYVTVSITGAGEHGNKILEGDALDLSQAGLCVEFEQPHDTLQPESTWNFTLTSHDHTMTIPGKIVWASENVYGVQFIKINRIQIETIHHFLAQDK